MAQKPTHPKKFKLILKLLSEGSTIGDACKSAKVNPHTVYNHRQNNPEYAIEWEEALGRGLDCLEAEAFRRAVTGNEEPVFYKGEQVALVRKYDSTMLIFLMKAANPKKYRDHYQSVKQPELPVVPVFQVATEEEARQQWDSFITLAMEKTGDSREKVIADLVAARPDAKQWVM